MATLSSLDRAQAEIVRQKAMRDWESISTAQQERNAWQREMLKNPKRLCAIMAKRAAEEKHAIECAAKLGIKLLVGSGANQQLGGFENKGGKGNGYET